MKRPAPWSCWVSGPTALLQVLVPVCVLACGPASRDVLATEHYATQHPTHHDSHGSRDSQLPNTPPACERAGAGLAINPSVIIHIGSGTVSPFLFDQPLLDRHAISFAHKCMLLTQATHSLTPPLVITLQL